MTEPTENTKDKARRRLILTETDRLSLQAERMGMDFSDDDENGEGFEYDN